MIPATNYVLIEPFGYNPVDKDTGMVVHADEEHLLQARIGKVIAVCDRLQYDGEEMHPYSDGRRLSFHEQNYAGYINSKSVYYDVPIEVEAGDTVIYRWMQNTNTTLHVEGKMLVRYDQLVVKKLDDGFYPLNGLVLIRMENKLSDDPFLDKVQMRRSAAKVVAEGCLVKSYLSFPGEVDQPEQLMGKTVIFDHRMAVRIEYDNFRLFNYDSEYPYYMIHRKDIHAHD